ncbi:outer membrane protein assembly factor BamB [Holospora obtusa F1]|uniref:Outer membrane protein assembly factor BamB n=1 Tax=Holospora obtusa F1 TaxID=1399147 RepID=W6TDQ5_HOLOB|nr:PQQ-binding-like beta-propeller repeat protein [Holospora obtusa]ETZ07218.1 outer membrane protein assembly factor BamB [Holospora obtusa F1]
MLKKIVIKKIGTRFFLGFFCGMLLWRCTSEVDLPPLKGKRESVTVEDEFSMEHQKVDSKKRIPMSAYSVCVPGEWLQYYCNSQHKLPALGFSGHSQCKILPKVHQLYVENFACQGAAPSPVFWSGCVYILKGLKLYQGHLKKGKFFLLHEIDLSEIRQDMDPDSMGGIAVLPSGIAFLTMGSSELVSLCLKKRKILWRKSLEFPAEGAPVLGKNIVVCVTRRNQTLAFDQKNGTLLWTHQGAVEDLSLWGGSSSAISKGIVISHYSSNQVVALAEKTGDLLWTQNFAISKMNREKIPHQKASPVCVDELVYVVTHSNVACLGIRSGETLWQWPIGGYHTPLVLGDFLFFVDQNGVLSRVNRYTGEVYWTQILPKHAQEQWNVWIGPWYINHRLLLWRYDGLMICVNPFFYSQDCENLKKSAIEAWVSLGHPLSASGVLLRDGIVLHSDDGGILSWLVTP